MKPEITRFVESLDRRTFTNNTQRVLHTMLTTPGDGWVSLARTRVPSAGARIRDLRKASFGRINVECKAASELGLRGDSRTFLYRVSPRGLTVTQLRSVFG